MLLRKTRRMAGRLRNIDAQRGFRLKTIAATILLIVLCLAIMTGCQRTPKLHPDLAMSEKELLQCYRDGAALRRQAVKAGIRDTRARDCFPATVDRDIAEDLRIADEIGQSVSSAWLNTDRCIATWDGYDDERDLKYDEKRFLSGMRGRSADTLTVHVILSGRDDSRSASARVIYIESSGRKVPATAVAGDHGVYSGKFPLYVEGWPIIAEGETSVVVGVIPIVGEEDNIVVSLAAKPLTSVNAAALADADATSSAKGDPRDPTAYRMFGRSYANCTDDQRKAVDADRQRVASGADSEETPEHAAVVAVLPSPDRARMASYDVVLGYDESVPGRSRASFRVSIANSHATSRQVRASLTDAAKRSSATAVMVFGYWPGDDVSGAYTAGRLEWSRDGRNWSGDGRLPSGGRFD
jgi:hypothetical protein